MLLYRYGAKKVINMRGILQESLGTAYCFAIVQHYVYTHPADKCYMLLC